MDGQEEEERKWRREKLMRNDNVFSVVFVEINDKGKKKNNKSRCCK